ncbi:hypothetical protein CC78DRAFT_539168 [Lojkania enalia]|uniref:BZIP domain-containing protein n=1 Tax=Lojkania enalia TaxID=147567 RepID=A0A9P4TRT4_9PLEO|nr:hypothetical protein CC78DRAFT_539168 [Didymosphaeria enalia]
MGLGRPALDAGGPSEKVLAAGLQWHRQPVVPKNAAAAATTAAGRGAISRGVEEDGEPGEEAHQAPLSSLLPWRQMAGCCCCCCRRRRWSDSECRGGRRQAVIDGRERSRGGAALGPGQGKQTGRRACWGGACGASAEESEWLGLAADALRLLRLLRLAWSCMDERPAASRFWEGRCGDAGEPDDAGAPNGSARRGGLTGLTGVTGLPSLLSPPPPPPCSPPPSSPCSSAPVDAKSSSAVVVVGVTPANCDAYLLASLPVFWTVYALRFGRVAPARNIPPVLRCRKGQSTPPVRPTPVLCYKSRAMDFSANSNAMDFHRPSSTLSSVDRKPSTFSFDDSTTLDSNILDTPAIMSPTTSTQGIFSPDTSLWEDFSAGQFVDRTASSSVVHHSGTNPFFTEQSNNPFARIPANQAATYGQQTSWPVADNAGSRTPTASKPLNPFGPSDFDSNSSTFVPAPSQMPSAFGSHHGLPLHSNVRPSSVFPPAPPEQPLSPHTNAEWMAFNQQEMDAARPGPKRVRPNSPPRSFSPRRDGGIRKKNARFDIPADRNLFNIDQLIASCTNEEDMKELKQQKRLLRNRQAALDSRQRKKRHTEELEEEKKQWAEKMCQLEEDFGTLRMEYDALKQEKEAMLHERMEMHQMISQLQYDKEELVRTHTLESGDLRKKISVLTERLEATSSGMAVAPSTTFNDFASEMDNLNMSSNEWDNYIFVNDFAVDEQTPAPQQQEQSLVIAPRSKEGEDKPVASGLLLMLLLCGAFVASKSSGSSAPPIPRMPDEVRAASATVLDSIFKDAGVAPSLTEQGVIANRVSDLEPGPSGVNWPKSTVSGSELAGLSGSNLDQLHAQLTVPSKEHEHEQLFSITPAQYNSVTSMDFSRTRYSIASDDLSDSLSPGSQPSHRRNLAEALAAMREQSKGDTAAEVYTRSLLWDRIAPEVVHEFKRIVEETTASSRPSTSDGSRVEVDNVG